MNSSATCGFIQRTTEFLTSREVIGHYFFAEIASVVYPLIWAENRGLQGVRAKAHTWAVRFGVHGLGLLAFHRHSCRRPFFSQQAGGSVEWLFCLSDRRRCWLGK